MAIFPNVCLWQRIVCAQTWQVYIDPENLYWGTFVCQYAGLCCCIVWPLFLFDCFVKIWAICKNFLGKWSTAPPGRKLPVRLCLYISVVIAELQGNTSTTYCIRTLLATIVLRVLGIASLSHLALVNLERYIAIKHALRYETIVTEKRLTCLSALLWIILLTITVSLSFFDENTYLKVDTITLSLCITTIIFCQVVLYHETRRHQKEIAAGQFSMEAREKFLREKKAFKLTTMILFSLILCYLPFVVARILISKSVINSVNLAYIALFTARTVAIFNSMVNPIIYCVRIRQFRVAFIQLLFRKSSTEA